MGKLKDYYTMIIDNPIDDSEKLDLDYHNYLQKNKVKRYISSEEFDLMTEDELDYYYGKPETSLEGKGIPKIDMKL